MIDETRKKNVVVFMADGMEMCECLLTVDILMRAGVNVIKASVMDSLEITSSHQVKVLADVLAEDVDFDDVDMIVLPGGRIGSENLAASNIVAHQCIDFAAAGKKIAAVCAAPSVFAGLGLLDGRKATCHPDFEDKVEYGGAHLTHESVTVDDNIITGQGLGATMDFALTLAEILTDGTESTRIAKSICYRYWE